MLGRRGSKSETSSGSQEGCCCEACTGPQCAWQECIAIAKACRQTRNPSQGPPALYPCKPWVERLEGCTSTPVFAGCMQSMHGATVRNLTRTSEPFLSEMVHCLKWSISTRVRLTCLFSHAHQIGCHIVQLGLRARLIEGGTPQGRWRSCCAGWQRRRG